MTIDRHVQQSFVGYIGNHRFDNESLYYLIDYILSRLEDEFEEQDITIEQLNKLISLITVVYYKGYLSNPEIEEEFENSIAMANCCEKAIDEAAKSMCGSR